MLPWWAWLIVLIIIIGVAYGIGSLNKKNTENN
jgi:hypothetical protein